MSFLNGAASGDGAIDGCACSEACKELSKLGFLLLSSTSIILFSLFLSFYLSGSLFSFTVRKLYERERVIVRLFGVCMEFILGRE